MQSYKYKQPGRAFRAGMLYFVGVFALGIAFGGVRLILLEPWLGETWAVVVETPVILGLSWLLCARAIERLRVAPVRLERGSMGLTALVFLLSGEFLLWLFVFGNSPQSFLARYLTLAEALGLVGQLLFALFPLMQLRFRAQARPA